MRDHRFETSITLKIPLGEVFPFFAEAGNLERITPDHLSFRILSPLPIRMQVGAVIEYRLRLLGVPFHWKSGITEWDPPYQFVDSQLRGPYRKWVHTHSFSEHRGSTTITDRVVYQLPLWPLGELALPLVRRQIATIFRFRELAIRSYFRREEHP